MAMIVLMAALMWGCDAELYHGLSEREVNAMIVVLEQHGISADKLPDPNADDGGWILIVADAESNEAYRILKAVGMPKPRVDGFGKFYPSSGLIPTSSEEQVLLQYATAQEIRLSLLKIDGVVEAHVNLVLPRKPRVQLSTTKVEPPRASVVIKYRALKGADGKAPPAPVSDKDVQTLVAGGVEGLEPAAVKVLLTPARQSAEPLKAPEFEKVGPIVVRADSKTALLLLIGIMGTMIVVLAGAMILLVLRRRSAPQA